MKSVILVIYKIIFSILGRLLPKDSHVIVFESFLGKQYSDSPRAIYEYLRVHHPEFKMYWSAERNSLQQFDRNNVQHVKRFSPKWMFVMNRAKYWVTNSRLPLWIPKPAGTIYVQTWHGTPLKKLATDMTEVHMAGTKTEQYKKDFLTEAKKWDYLISPNEYSTTIFKRAFKFDKSIVESGYPRNDYLLNENNNNEAENVKRKIDVPTDKKVILYAPTWRDNQFHDQGKYKFDLQMDLDLLQKELSDEYVILLRLHYLVAESLDLSNYKDFVYDFSLYEDIRELYLISDLLVTDYSSVFFDYANLKRPMIFYVYDIEEYRDLIRGFYFNFEEEAPGPLVKTTEALIQEIKNMRDGFEYDDIFYKEFCYLEDGSATERVVKEIFTENKGN